MANSFLPGRSNSPLGNYTVDNYLVAVSQSINPFNPTVATSVTGITGATYAQRNLTMTDVLASYENGSSVVCGIFGYSPYSVYTDANGVASIQQTVPNVSLSAMPFLPLPTYASSIDPDSILGTAQAPFYTFNQQFQGRAATTGTATGTLTATGKLMTITALGTATVIPIGALVTGTGLAAQTYIVSQTSGTPGGAGVYVLSAAPTTETSETITVGLQPVTVTMGVTNGQSFGLQYNNFDSSWYLDFSGTYGVAIGNVVSINEQDPSYNLLSNQCYVGCTLSSTYNQFALQKFYAD